MTSSIPLLATLSGLAQVASTVVVADECHHVPAAAFEHAVKQIPARRWLGLTATPYRRDKLDDLIALQVGPVRHTIALSRHAAGQDTLPGTRRSSRRRRTPPVVQLAGAPEPGITRVR